MSLLKSYGDIFRLIDETARAPSAHPNRNRRTFSPSFDVHETDKAYILEGELPGLSNKSNVSIEFTDPQTLLVRGKLEHHREESSPEGGAGTEKTRYWVSERTTGEFQRSFSFPSYVDLDNVSATLEHGLLKVNVPKKESQVAKRIEIA